ncbi:MAG: hypothetical protein LiPW30_518 [Parcubacteria group bacterium LiPW_30]|nr:MAG: hypothetical protein LiPW30_518 [Parcubacteria group bacterium LiPW_30]
MDTLAHGLWGGLSGRALSNKTRRVSAIKAFLWGVFPDLFAFTIPIFFLLWNIFFGDMPLSYWPPPSPHVEPSQDLLPFSSLVNNLYNISHSFFVFGVIFGFVYVFTKRLPLEMFGWFLHILFDIPTHSYQFFPTPFLWPFSDFKVDGISWGVLWFMVLNYSVLLLFYAIIRFREKNKKI